MSEFSYCGFDHLNLTRYFRYQIYVQINTNFTRQNYTQQSDIYIFVPHFSSFRDLSEIFHILDFFNYDLWMSYLNHFLSIKKNNIYIYIYCSVSWTEFIIFFYLDFPVEEIKRKSSKQAAT